MELRQASNIEEYTEILNTIQDLSDKELEDKWNTIDLSTVDDNNAEYCIIVNEMYDRNLI